MIFNSIKGRLQLWYGLILVVVLAGFGFTAFQLERGRQMRRIDEQLQRRAGAIANLIRPGPMQGRNPGNRPRDDNPNRRPPPEQLPDDPAFPPERPVWAVDGFQMPPLPAGMFDESITNGFYYILWSRDGKELSRSSNAPQGAGFSPAVSQGFHLGPWAHGNNPPKNPTPFRPGDAQRIPPITLGHLRESLHLLPRGDLIGVGCSIEPEQRELRLTAVWLAAVGGAVLLVGLVGGWWMVTLSLRPVQDISTTATKIAAGDLAQRINVANTENELGQLAGVLNSTFSRLDAAFTQQQQFTSDVAHELRTPVSVMLTQTQTTLNRERNSTEYRETVESCQRAAQRMRRLIESLLELARLDAGQEQMKRMPFDLARIAGDCVELIRPLANERGVSFHCDLPEIKCIGDPERISQVITNLLANAVNYNKANGEVRVDAHRQDGLIVLTVADTGVGISTEDLPHVFERFYRADKSRSSGHAGLGLAICKAIVEAHSGTIEVSSTPGSGTTFTVRLPTGPIPNA